MEPGKIKLHYLALPKRTENVLAAPSMGEQMQTSETRKKIISVGFDRLEIRSNWSSSFFSKEDIFIFNREVLN